MAPLGPPGLAPGRTILAECIDYELHVNYVLPRRATNLGGVSTGVVGLTFVFVSQPPKTKL